MEAEVICQRTGSSGVITLNRPKALNALTLSMVRLITKALEDWRHEPAVSRVIFKSGGGKAFCAGGDIRILYELGLAGRHAEQLSFWREEYQLNRFMRVYQKPIVSLVDGIVMGGGAGLAMHGTHVIAADRFTFAMPEAAIGFFPDVGASFFLPRLSSHAGTYLALTSAKMDCGDALAFGVASAHVPSDRLTALEDRLIGGDDIRSAIASEASLPPPSQLMPERELMEECFSLQTLSAILGQLDEAGHAGSDFARSTATSIRLKSPLSLSIALRQMQLGARLSIDEALRMEFRIANRILTQSDFYEGVRAVIVDKDNRPRWNPRSIESVTPRDIDLFFASLTAGELEFDSRRIAG
ncbi:MAG TPA: enoyl-CoA hydratase/isomerase family protein [Methylocella sp.]|nr:enoyl-CoA hydratase/isomerase family protein [Methylocella sp.]